MNKSNTNTCNEPEKPFTLNNLCGGVLRWLMKLWELCSGGFHPKLITLPYKGFFLNVSTPQIVKIHNGNKCSAIRKSPSWSIMIGSMLLLIMRSHIRKTNVHLAHYYLCINIYVCTTHCLIYLNPRYDILTLWEYLNNGVWLLWCHWSNIFVKIATTPGISVMTATTHTIFT